MIFKAEEAYQKLRSPDYNKNSISCEAEGVWLDMGVTRIKIYKPTENNKRYYCKLFSFSKDYGRRSYARYLMSLYLDKEIDKSLDVDHINNNRIDDRIENLQLLNKSDNYIKHVYNSLDQKIELINKVIEDYCNGLTYDQIAEKRKIHKSTAINYIINSDIKTRTTFIYNNEELQNKIIEDYQNGILIEDIMSKYEVSHTTINRLINNKHIKKRKSNKKQIENKIKEIEKDVINLYKSKVNINDILSKFKIHEGLLRRIIYTNNISTRHKKPIFVKRSKIMEEKIKNLYEQKVSVNEIAKQLNVGTDTVNRTLNRLNVKKRRPFLTKEEVYKRHEEIIKEYANGLSREILAKKYNMTTKGIWLIIKNTDTYAKKMLEKEENKKTRLKGSAWVIYKKEIALQRIENAKKSLELHDKGMSNHDIGIKLDISHQTVAIYLAFGYDGIKLVEDINNFKIDIVRFKNRSHWLKHNSYIYRQIKSIKKLSNKGNDLVVTYKLKEE